MTHQNQINKALLSSVQINIKREKILLKNILKIFFIIFVLLGLFVFWTICSIDKTELATEIQKQIIYKPSKQLVGLIPALSPKAEEKSFLSQDGIKINYLRIKGIKTSL